MTEYIASSAEVGRRPRICLICSYSSALRPRSAKGCSTSGFAAANSTVSLTFFEVFCGESTCVESAELRFDDLSSSGPFHTTRHSWHHELCPRAAGEGRSRGAASIPRLGEVDARPASGGTSQAAVENGGR